MTIQEHLFQGKPVFNRKKEGDEENEQHTVTINHLDRRRCGTAIAIDASP
jgi:hypothetical protein